MEILESQLWDYIDGVSSPQESEIIHQRILINPDIEKRYSELLALSKQLSAIELDAPSMSFSRNVLDKLAGELAPVALKSQTDKRIIYSIGAFFVITLAALLVYSFDTASLQANVRIPNLGVAQIHQLSSGISVKAFILIDILLALFCMDAALRKNLHETKKRPTI